MAAQPVGAQEGAPVEIALFGGSEDAHGCTNEAGGDADDFRRRRDIEVALLIGKRDRVDTRQPAAAELGRKRDRAVAGVESLLAVLADSIEVGALVVLAHDPEDLQVGIALAPHPHLLGPRPGDGREPGADLGTPGLQMLRVELAHRDAPSATRTVHALMPGAP